MLLSVCLHQGAAKLWRLKEQQQFSSPGSSAHKHLSLLLIFYCDNILEHFSPSNHVRVSLKVQMEEEKHWMVFSHGAFIFKFTTLHQIVLLKVAALI